MTAVVDRDVTPAPIHDAAGVRRWRCRACGYRGPWGKGIACYSHADVDNGHWEKVEYYCSGSCRNGGPPPERTGPTHLIRGGSRPDFSLTRPPTGPTAA